MKSITNQLKFWFCSDIFSLNRFPMCLTNMTRECQLLEYIAPSRSLILK